MFREEFELEEATSAVLAGAASIWTIKRLLRVWSPTPVEHLEDFLASSSKALADDELDLAVRYLNHAAGRRRRAPQLDSEEVVNGLLQRPIRLHRVEAHVGRRSSRA